MNEMYPSMTMVSETLNERDISPSPAFLNQDPGFQNSILLIFIFNCFE